MRWAALLAVLLLALFSIGVALLFGVPSGSRATSASAPAASPTCSVKPACAAGEVAVFRMSSTANAHAGTAGGSSYGNVVCCGGVHNLSNSCSAVYDSAVTLSGADNAHVAADGSYAAQACLSVPYGVADCTYGTTCGTDYQCLATVSGDSNAHVADCDGAGDYATKVCCYVEDDNDNDGLLDPPDPDDDNDLFDDSVEAYVATDPWDACPDVVGAHDAWPLDINMDTVITVVGDVLNYSGRIGATGGPPPSANWWQRLDLNMDNVITVVGDVLKFSGNIGRSCT